MLINTDSIIDHCHAPITEDETHNLDTIINLYKTEKLLYSSAEIVFWDKKYNEIMNYNQSYLRQNCNFLNKFLSFKD